MDITRNLSLSDVERVLYHHEPIHLPAAEREHIAACYDFLQAFSVGKVIYGINTGFGPMAQWRIDDLHLRELQYNIIRSHAVGAGRPLPEICVRAAMLARLQTFVQARSGVHPQVVELLIDLLNRGITPIVPEHGSVGASGDLVQLAHIALALIGEGEVLYRGERRDTASVLESEHLQPLRIGIREGLAVTNGTAVMTGIGLVNLLQARRLFSWSLVSSVLMNEIASSYDDFLSDTLNRLKHHPGQRTVAARMRRCAQGSRCLLQREVTLYRNPGDNPTFQHKVQPYYSLRCTPQILGPVLDTLDHAERILLEELNAVDDNPIVDPESRNVYHGGNFHGDYVSFEMDKLKIAVTKMTLLAERQLNYLFHDRINGILPPFVNLGTLGLNYGLQAAQFTATSTTAESQTLSNPMYIHTIPNNNDNQDIVSMGTNSALLCRHVIENAGQVLAIQLLALAQAVDSLSIADRLAPATRSLYDRVRALVPLFRDDTPKYREIEQLQTLLFATDPETAA
ncbi:histidine ammonia-lyase [uncultured Rikenella sp.]|uniref:HAL/PAL/TAL family ammonia-lyase n=1 Tax=uncultured Rikenella sp. TaxID=368003 RepID=UPI00261428BB|nr:aromatic amino acid ammonia-lyase [uncultured Rikenella sp.]